MKRIPEVNYIAGFRLTILKFLLRYIVQFFSKECPPAYFLAVTIMLAVPVYFNYAHHLDPTQFISEKRIGKFMLYYLLFASVYSGAFIIQKKIYKNAIPYSNTSVLLILLAPAFFAFRLCFNWQEPWVKANAPAGFVQYYLQTTGWLVRGLILILPVYIFWRLTHKSREPFYGMKPIPSVRPYLFLLALTIPIMALSFTDKNILSYYPRVQTLYRLPTANYFHYLFFELSYAFDFLSIEIFFRGALVLAFASNLGMRCIVPMAAFYCCIHFGKPLPECISSYFGGILLGIIAYRTKSVWGGLILHLGMAWLMELGGALLR
jgi:hypothetical protein